MTYNFTHEIQANWTEAEETTAIKKMVESKEELQTYLKTWEEFLSDVKIIELQAVETTNIIPTTKKEITPELKAELANLTHYANYYNSSRVLTGCYKLAENIYRLECNTCYHRWQKTVWDFVKNQKIDLRKKEYKHLKGIEGIHNKELANILSY